MVVSWSFNNSVGEFRVFWHVWYVWRYIFRLLTTVKRAIMLVDSCSLSLGMNLISWNCQGWDNPCAIRSLKVLIVNKYPMILFVSETKLLAKDMEKFRKKKLFWNLLSYRCGWLALLWYKDADIFQFHHSQYQIDCIIHVYGNIIGLSFIIGFRTFYYLLTMLQLCRAWVCLGKLQNEILDPKEKLCLQKFISDGKV